MTCQETVKTAREQGYTEVQTLAGWLPLADWTPYGFKDGHRYVTFRLDKEGRIHEDYPEGARIPKLGDGFVYGLWTLR